MSSLVGDVDRWLCGPSGCRPRVATVSGWGDADKWVVALWRLPFRVFFLAGMAWHVFALDLKKATKLYCIIDKKGANKSSAEQQKHLIQRFQFIFKTNCCQYNRDTNSMSGKKPLLFFTETDYIGKTELKSSHHHTWNERWLLPVTLLNYYTKVDDLTDDQLNALIERVDQRGNGLINYSEPRPLIYHSLPK